MSYAPNINSIFYQTSGFKTGVEVSIKFWDEKDSWSLLKKMDEIGEGFYRIKYDFINSGPYIGKVFENGVPKKSGIFRIFRFARESAINYTLINEE